MRDQKLKPLKSFPTKEIVGKFQASLLIAKLVSILAKLKYNFWDL